MKFCNRLANAALPDVSPSKIGTLSASSIGCDARPTSWVHDDKRLRRDSDGGEMYLLKRTTVALAAVATLGVGTARADLVLIGTTTVGGTGLGNVNTVLTLTSQGNNTTEQGCVGRGAAADVIGSTAAGVSVAGATTDVMTGSSQTQTRSLAEAAITTGTNFALLP